MTERKFTRARHWKQRFTPGARFKFRKRGNWYGKTYDVGDPIPQELQDDHRRLRRAWDTRLIELEVFEPIHVRTGQAMSEWEREQSEERDATVEEVIDVIGKLDRANKALFTKNGLGPPRVDVIQNVLGPNVIVDASIRNEAWGQING